MPTETISPADPSHLLLKDQIDAHRAMVLWLFIATVVVTGMMGLALVLTDISLNPQASYGGKRQMPILLFVSIAGAIGSFVSCLKRLYAFDDIFPRKQYVILFRKFDPYLIAYSTIPPLIGIIAASAVYGIFAAGLLNGPMFPVFNCAEGGSECKSFPDFLGYWRPTGPTDYAKALVWGFISGFSERFFVDILNQFGGEVGRQRTAA